MESANIRRPTFSPVDNINPVAATSNQTAHHVSLDQSPIGTARVPTGNFPSNAPTLLPQGIRDLRLRVNWVVDPARISAPITKDALGQMVAVAQEFPSLAATMQVPGDQGAEAKRQGQEMLILMADACSRMTIVPGQGRKMAHAKEVQKAMVKLVFRYAHVFFDEPGTQVQLLSKVIKQAHKIHLSETRREFCAQGEITRRLKENVTHYHIDTLIELAKNVTPQDVARFSLKIPAGHSSVARDVTLAPGTGLSVATIVLGAMANPVGLAVMGAAVACMAVGAVAAPLADKLYQKIKNKVTDRQTSQDRMIRVMLTEPLKHPLQIQNGGQLHDKLHEYFACILDTVDTCDPGHTLPYSQDAFAAYLALSRDDQDKITAKRTVIPD
jgi:hypothetical protein